MSAIEELKQSLSEKFIELVDNDLKAMKKGCMDCGECTNKLHDITNRLFVIDFTDRDYVPSGSSSQLIVQTSIPRNKTITISDFELDGFTYLDSSYAGYTTYEVFLNTAANRFITFELDGFLRLPQGGFIIDPSKLVLELGQELKIFI